MCEDALQPTVTSYDFRQQPYVLPTQSDVSRTSATFLGLSRKIFDCLCSGVFSHWSWCHCLSSVITSYFVTSSVIPQAGSGPIKVLFLPFSGRWSASWSPATSECPSAHINFIVLFCPWIKPAKANAIQYKAWNYLLWNRQYKILVRLAPQGFVLVPILPLSKLSQHSFYSYTFYLFID